MDFPILDAPLAVQVHAATALAATALGAGLFLARKGGGGHRAAGRGFVALVAVMAVSSLFIHELRWWGPWSPLHLLSGLTLAGLPFWMFAARRGWVRLHAAGMAVLFVGGLMLSGTFSFMPDRRLGASVLDLAGLGG